MTLTEDEKMQGGVDAQQKATPRERRSVYERMVAVIEELPAIGKTQRNREQGFMFRGHDDVMNALNPLLAKHGVFIVPNVLERVTATRTTSRGSTMYEVNLHVEFTFYGRMGDSFTASGWGEGTDMGDKATNKAMTGAFKYVVAQTFALATAETSDADATSPEETLRGEHRPAGDPGAESRVVGDPGTEKEPDPAKTLIGGALAVRSVEDARSIRDGLRALDGTQDWPAIEDYLATSVYGHGLDELTKPETAEYWKRLSNAVRRANPEGGDFPPVETEVMQAAFAWAFNGTVVAFSEPVAAEEAEVQQSTQDEESEAQELNGERAE